MTARLPGIFRFMSIEELLDLQSGVISRAQVHACGDKPWDIKRRLRRREWVRLLPGVYVDHTGEPTWHQCAWAGVLYLEPAALAGNSAVRAVVGPAWRHHDDDDPIEIAIPSDRNVEVPAGYRRRRTSYLDERVQWQTHPPRVRIEEAALDLAAAAPTEFAAIGLLADVCQTRRTTAPRLLKACAGRRRLRRRRWLGAVLTDIAEGTCSVLEHAYLTRVERAHGLPAPRRQADAESDRGPAYRDVEYDAFGLVVELDGRLFHNSASQRDVDLDRDLDAAVDGRLSVRLGWGQVVDRGCRSAGKVAELLQLRGWTGSPRDCGPSCALSQGQQD